VAKCPEHLKDFRWKKGESGNPDGLRKRPSFEAVVGKILDERIPGSDTTKRETLARVFVDSMLKRNGQMIREYLARAWPAVQKHEVELPGVSDASLEISVDRFLAGEDEPVPAKPNGNGAAAS
jgi:hypothetical protein